jgi:hypothetical protein
LAYTQHCYFQRKEKQWRVDLPTPDERRAEQRSREKASAKPASDAEEKRSRTFASPEEVWAAFTTARAAFDAPTLWDCLMPQDREAFIGMVWGEQFHFQNDAPTLHEVIDEERRRKLTFQRLPGLHDEIWPLLLDSLTDRRAAFALSIHVFHRERETYPGKLEELKIDGNRATAQVERSPEKKKEQGKEEERAGRRRVPDIAFAKDAQGWRVTFTGRFEGIDTDEPDAERSEEAKKAKALKPRDPKPWSGRPAPAYQTPQDVHAALHKGMMENDPEAMWHCETEALRNRVMKENILMLVESGGGDAIMSWYIDMGKLHDLQNLHARNMRRLSQELPQVEDDPDGQDTTEAKRQRERLDYHRSLDWEALLARAYYDPRAYFSAIVKRLDLTNRRQHIRHPDAKPSSLGEVTTKGDRAIGVKTVRLVTSAVQITREGEEPEPMASTESSFQSTTEFAKVDGSWRLDVPTLEEYMAQWEKQQEENRKSREELRNKEKEEE